jgi:FMN phosphatase YigB (HAD superfamily)
MVGDSWAADVAGALAAGIVPVWFNPLGRPLPVASPDVAELRALEPVEHAVETILGTHSNRANRD